MAPEDRFDSVSSMAEAFAQAIDELEEAPPESGRRPSSFPSEASRDGEPELFDEISIEDDDPSEDALPALLDSPPALDSGVRDFVPDAEADQSGRRRALSEAEASNAVSPTFSGAAKALRPEPRRPRPWLTGLGVAAAAAVVIVASFAMVGTSATESAPPAAGATDGGDPDDGLVASPADPPAPAGAVASHDAGGGGAGAAEDGAGGESATPTP